jgi:hypothetical protein
MVKNLESFVLHLKEIENVETGVWDRPKTPVIIRGISITDEL